MTRTIDEVKNFWENNPLWTGESKYKTGSLEFFEEHRDVVISDCYAGQMDERIMPDKEHREFVLDLGCGPGFWLVELARRGCKNIVAADLTENALNLAKLRCQLYKIDNVTFMLQNAEALTLEDGIFDHVNCQGVIHHTPNTEKAVLEIARVLRDGGTASISVYYRNFFLRNWRFFKRIGNIVSKLGGGFKGRGRENIFDVSDTDEIVRLYDGNQNPVGKSYSRNRVIKMFAPWFSIEELYLHYFPARTLPIRIPSFLHRILDRRMGFMIHATLRKKAII